MRLEGGCHLFEAIDGQALGMTKSVFVAVPVIASIGHPAGPTGITIRAQPFLVSDEAERVERR